MKPSNRRTAIGVGLAAIGLAGVIAVGVIDSSSPKALSNSAACVQIAAGSSIQKAINTNPAGSAFCLSAGTWHLTASLNPLSGDSFTGVGTSTILTGGGATAYSFNAMAPAFTVADLTIEHFSSEGLDLYNGSTASDLTVTENVTGVGMHGSDDLLEGSQIFDNGNITEPVPSDDYGVTTSGASNGVLLSNDIFDNNTGCNPTAQNGGGAGASKFWESTDMTLEGDTWSGNYGNGIWLDGSSSHFTIRGETVTGNTAACPTAGVGGGEGIRLEVSCHTLVAKSTVTSNDGGGIDVVASFGNTVNQNLVSSDGTFGIRILGQPRTSPYGGDYAAGCGSATDNADNNAVTSNQVTVGSAYDGVVGTLQPVTGSSWTGNTYTGGACSTQEWKWYGSAESTTDFASWQAEGNDTSGSCT